MPSWSDSLWIQDLERSMVFRLCPPSLREDNRGEAAKGGPCASMGDCQTVRPLSRVRLSSADFVVSLAQQHSTTTTPELPTAS